MAGATSLGWIALGFYLLLAGCSSVPVAQCPPLKEYTPEFNQRLGNEVDAMPADSATVEAIGDYIALRDSVKACTGDKP
jgi:hypothetical protein